jgi:hypothetical protein
MASGDYRVADISLADFGRKEIELAEHEVSFLSNRIFFLTDVSHHDCLPPSDAWFDGLPS